MNDRFNPQQLQNNRKYERFVRVKRSSNDKTKFIPPFTIEGLTQSTNNTTSKGNNSRFDFNLVVAIEDQTNQKCNEIDYIRAYPLALFALNENVWKRGWEGASRAEGNFFRYQGTPPWMSKETSFQLTPWRFEIRPKSAILFKTWLNAVATPLPLPPSPSSWPFNNAGRYIVWRDVSCGEWTVVMSVVMSVDKLVDESRVVRPNSHRILGIRNVAKLAKKIDNRDKTRFHERYPGGRGGGERRWRSRDASMSFGWKTDVEAKKKEGKESTRWIDIIRSQETRNGRIMTIMTMTIMNLYHPFDGDVSKSFDRVEEYNNE